MPGEKCPDPGAARRVEHGLNPLAITHALHQLEYAGLVRRVPSEHDGRSVQVALTPAGAALVDRVGREHLANERRILATLTAEEQATLAGLLRRLLISFEEQ